MANTLLKSAIRCRPRIILIIALIIAGCSKKHETDNLHDSRWLKCDTDSECAEQIADAICEDGYCRDSEGNTIETTVNDSGSKDAALDGSDVDDGGVSGKGDASNGPLPEAFRGVFTFSRLLSPMNIGIDPDGTFGLGYDMCDVSITDGGIWIVQGEELVLLPGPDRDRFLWIGPPDGEVVERVILTATDYGFEARSETLTVFQEQPWSRGGSCPECLGLGPGEYAPCENPSILDSIDLHVFSQRDF